MRMAGTSLAGMIEGKGLFGAQARRVGRLEEPSPETEGLRSIWIVCRECLHRERVPCANRSELIRVLDAGLLKCKRCGGRMVEV